MHAILRKSEFVTQTGMVVGFLNFIYWILSSCFWLFSVLPNHNIISMNGLEVELIVNKWGFLYTVILFVL